MNLGKSSGIDNLDFDLQNRKLTVFRQTTSAYEKTTLFPPSNPSKTAQAIHANNISNHSELCRQRVNRFNKTAHYREIRPL